MGLQIYHPNNAKGLRFPNASSRWLFEGNSIAMHPFVVGCVKQPLPVSLNLKSS